MVAFRFRLESVLKLRETERQQRRTELAQGLEAERILERQAHALSAELMVARNRYRQSALPGEVDVDQLMELQRYVLHIVAQANALGQRQASVREEVERRRRALIEADRQVRLLEKLRQKQHEAFDRERAKLEQKELDEVGARTVRSRWNRAIIERKDSR